MAGIIEKKLSFITIKASLTKIGDDYNLLISGGKEHIGCTVLALPRPSLTGDGTISATSSVINVTGHKDELVCRYLAERLCAYANAAVVCTGGIHADNISKDQIDEIMQAAQELAADLEKIMQH